MLAVPLVFLLTFCSTHGAKVLLIPGPSVSHCLEMMAFGEELLRRGHHITLYPLFFDPDHCISRVNADSFKPRFKTVSLKTDELHQKAYKDGIEIALEYFFKRKPYLYFMAYGANPLMRTICDAAFYDNNTLKELKDDKYDIAIVEALPFTGCLFAVPLYLGVPYVAFGSFIDPQDYRMPLQTNTFPSFFTEYTNEMTFTERLVNTMYFLLNPVIRHFILPSIDLTKYSSKLAGYDTRDLVKESVLFLENSDYIVDYPKAFFPNFVQVGAITAGPARPLSADLKAFMDNTNGIVLVTFGTFLNEIPVTFREKLMAAFDRLDHHILFKQDTSFTRGNIKILKWIPQNDILAHPNTKLFISHCGKNGFWEGVYHGVPVICMAIHAETYTTKVKVKKYGIGSSINLHDDSVDDIVQEIKNVLENKTIYTNMKKISTLLRDRPETPRERAASAIEHVIKYGGEHMRPPSVDMGFLSYTNIDVLCIICLTELLILVLLVVLISKCCCRKKIGKNKTE